MVEQPLHGTSGATITILGDRVVKRHDASDRIMEQGTWLQRHKTPILPTIYQVYARSYVMEKLDVAPLWALDHCVVLDAMITGLREHVWSEPPISSPNIEKTLSYVESIALRHNLPTFINHVEAASTYVKWGDVRACLTHGDPTFENVMFRPVTGELVLIDPIPSREVVPDLMSVDLGKILQSVMGWEVARYNSYLERIKIKPSTVELWALNDNEWHATIFWALVHITRVIPYVTTDVTERLVGVFNATYDLLV